MTPQTETLLKRCRTALLERSDEELDTLLQRWFECMIGEESMEEVLDDLCLLLDYRVRSWGQQTSYATYTAWWEVEGYCAEEGGEFLCADVALLRHRLLNISIKQFALVPDLAHLVLSLTAYDQSKPLLPTGYTFLYVFAEWLSDVTREFGDVQMQYQPPKQVNSKAQKRQRRERAKELIAQARQQGYVVVYPDTMEVVKSAFRHWCKEEIRPYICVEVRGAQVAKVFADMKTLGTLWVVMTTPQIQERLVALATPYISRAQEQARLHWETQWLVIFEEILMEDAEQVARDLVALSLDVLPAREHQTFQWQPSPREVAKPKNKREVAKPVNKPLPEPVIEPEWMVAIGRLRTQGNEQILQPLPEALVLPDDWPSLLTSPQLAAFLTFLGLSASARDLKAGLVERLQKKMEADQTVMAQLFEVFASELAVPPWELEELLKCTTTERKRWVEEGKIPVLNHRSFRKHGSEHDYPVFDRRVVLGISREELEGWRAEHQARIRERRRAGAQAAAASRKAKSQEITSAGGQAD